MRTRTSKLVAAALLVGGAAVVLSFRSTAAPPPDDDADVVVFKTASCLCCGKWVDHMKAAGFSVSVHDVSDIVAVKSRQGVPADLSSCHTALADGYVFEGHIPPGTIRAFLDDPPEAAGLAVPGMPIGSPGMEGPNARPYDVIAFGADGARTVYERVEP